MGRHFPVSAHAALSQFCPCTHCSVRRAGWISPWYAAIARVLHVPVADLFPADPLDLIAGVAHARARKEAAHVAV